MVERPVDIVAVQREVNDTRTRLDRLPLNPTPQQIDLALQGLRQRCAPLERSEHITPVLLTIDQHLTTLRTGTTATTDVRIQALETVRSELSGRMDPLNARNVVGRSISALANPFQEIARSANEYGTTGRTDIGKAGINLAMIGGMATAGYLGFKALFGKQNPPADGEQPQGWFGRTMSRVAGIAAAAAAVLGIGYFSQNRAQAADIARRNAGRVDLLPAANTPVDVPGVPGIQMIRQRLDGPQDEVFLISGGTRYRLGFVPAATPAGAPQNLSSNLGTISTRPGQAGVTLEFKDPAFAAITNGQGLRANLDTAGLTQLQAAIAASPTSNQVSLAGIPLAIDITNFTAAQLEYVRGMSTTPPAVTGTTLRITTNLVLRAAEPIPQLPASLTTTPPTQAEPRLVRASATDAVALPGAPAPGTLGTTEGATLEHNGIRLTRLVGRNAVRVEVLPGATAGARSINISGTVTNFNIAAAAPGAAAENPAALTTNPNVVPGSTRTFTANATDAIELTGGGILGVGAITKNIPANNNTSITVQGITITRLPGNQIKVEVNAAAREGAYTLKIGANTFNIRVAAAVAPDALPASLPASVSHNQVLRGLGTAPITLTIAGQNRTLNNTTATANFPNGVVVTRAASGDLTVTWPRGGGAADQVATMELKRGTNTKNITVNREAAPATFRLLSAAEDITKNTVYRRALPAAGNVSLNLTNATGANTVIAVPNAPAEFINATAEAKIVTVGTDRFVEFKIKNDFTTLNIKCPDTTVIATHNF